MYPFKRMLAHVLLGGGQANHSTSRGSYAACKFGAAYSSLRERRGVVAVGISGGVDSSIAALLLQRQVEISFRDCLKPYLWVFGLILSRTLP